MPISSVIGFRTCRLKVKLKRALKNRDPMGSVVEEHFL